MEKENHEDTILMNTLRSCMNDGIILGLKESSKILNSFLDRKVAEGYPEYISRKELKVFMDTYIAEMEKETPK